MGTWGHFSSSSRQIHPFPIREWEWADYAQPIDLSHQNFWHSDGPDISKAFEMMPRYSQVSSAASGSDFFFKRNSCLKTNPSPLHIGEKSFTKNGILLPKLFWPTLRKDCTSDREKLLKFEAECQEFAKFLRSLEQFIQTLKGQKNFW